MSNRLDPDQARHFVGPDLGPNCMQKLSADVTRRWHGRPLFVRQITICLLVLDLTKPPISKPPAAGVAVTELIIIGLFFVVWFASITLFYRRWQKIRILRPVGLLASSQPKNMGQIEVVKSANDSVLYCR